MIAVLDYAAGNLTSVACAVRHLGFEPTITSDPDVVARAERVIFPGVGAAGATMENLRERGLDAALRDATKAGKPVLGICIGCQVAFSHSAEDNGVDCLGLLEGDVVPFRFPEGVRRKVPHMGWNEVRFGFGNGSQADADADSDADIPAHPVLHGVPAGSQFYFVHSFHIQPNDPSCVLGKATYGEVEFTAAVASENLVAFQFHAEKSGPPGLKILDNFLRWTP